MCSEIMRELRYHLREGRGLLPTHDPFQEINKVPLMPVTRVKTRRGQRSQSNCGPSRDRPRPYRRSGSSPALRPFAPVIGRHGNNAAKDFNGASIPVFGHVVQRRKSRVDEGPQALADHLASVPFRDAEATGGVLQEAIKTLAKSHVVNFLPKSQEPFGRR